MPAASSFHLRTPQNLHSLFIASFFIILWLSKSRVSSYSNTALSNTRHVFLVNIRRRCCALTQLASARFRCFDGFCSSSRLHVSRLKTSSLGLFRCLSSSLRCLTLRLFKPSLFGLWKRLIKSSYFHSSSFIRALGNIRLTLVRHNS